MLLHRLVKENSDRARDNGRWVKHGREWELGAAASSWNDTDNLRLLLQCQVAKTKGGEAAK